MGRYLGKVIAVRAQGHDCHIGAIITQVEVPLHTQVVSVKALQNMFRDERTGAGTA